MDDRARLQASLASRPPERQLIEPLRYFHGKSVPGRAGFDAAIFSAHSLRSGFLTSAAAKGASIFKMMDQSGHKSIDTLRGYVRDAELFKDHAGTGLLRASGTEASTRRASSVEAC